MTMDELHYIPFGTKRTARLAGYRNTRKRLSPACKRLETKLSSVVPLMNLEKR